MNSKNLAFFGLFEKKWLKFIPKVVIIVKVRLLSLAEIAQLVEHFTRNEGVVGSSPIFGFYEEKENDVFAEAEAFFSFYEILSFYRILSFYQDTLEKGNFGPKKVLDNFLLLDYTNFCKQ